MKPQTPLKQQDKNSSAASQNLFYIKEKNKSLQNVYLTGLELNYFKMQLDTKSKMSNFFDNSVKQNLNLQATFQT
jgi:hypothetical protein